MKIAVLDNYDSFTYNLVHYLEQVSDGEIEVYRNDKIAVADLARFDKILLSPGPGIPSEAGILPEVIRTYAHQKSMLGICLGQQAIAEAFGGSLVNLDTVFHGISTPVKVIKDDVLFRNMPVHFNAGRYHSWVVNPADFPDSLDITATDEAGHIMALRHKNYNVRALQFHPESILTEHGLKILENWVNS